MNREEFDKVVHDFVDSRLDLLFNKNAGYNPDGDCLRNFKVAAELEQSTPEQALLGMAAKHIVSVYDMVHDGGHFPAEVWDEKLGDSMNFMLLLRAMVTETEGQRSVGEITQPIENA